MIINRIKAACLAFKKPTAVYDGLMLESLAIEMERRREFCLFTGDWIKGHYIPRFEMIAPQTQHAIKNNLGVNI